MMAPNLKCLFLFLFALSLTHGIITNTFAAEPDPAPGVTEAAPATGETQPVHVNVETDMTPGVVKAAPATGETQPVHVNIETDMIPGIVEAGPATGETEPVHVNALDDAIPGVVEAGPATGETEPVQVNAETDATPASAATQQPLPHHHGNGPCEATNLIDQCWRCKADWAENRQKLADCALGFGRNATGGKGGAIYVVTDPSDQPQEPKEGTLRYGVIQKEPLWIIFKESFTIKLTQPLLMESYKTIDGRGVRVTITEGAGITVQNSHHIIIHNIRINNIIPTEGGMVRASTDHLGLRTHDDGDGVSLFNASNIWVDHLSMTHCADGLVDAIEGSTAITISNCHFTDHDKAMLFGARDNNPVDEKMQITIAYNHFGERMIQRMPRCRTGFFHVVNNDYTHWNMYAIGGSSNPTIISQGNRYIAAINLPPAEQYKKEVTHKDTTIPKEVWSKWTWVSDKDIFENGAHFTTSGDPNGAETFASLELIKAAPGEIVKKMTTYAGFLKCIPGKPC